jgi:DNA repair protein REV1
MASRIASSSSRGSRAIYISDPEWSARVAAGRAFATAFRRGLPQVEGRPRTSHENEDHIEDYLKASRLHFIGEWKTRYEQLLDSRDEPPPLPAVRPGCERVVAHVDMDCFFASIATRGRPELAGLPVAVSWADASSSGNGEIAAANYEARSHGVQNGSWLKNALALCPDLVTMPYEFAAYTEAAGLLYRAVFEVTPHVMGVSCDECYCDLTGLPEPEAAAAGLRRAVRCATGCNASIGIGPNPLLARVATRRAKPDGQVRIASAAAAAELRYEKVANLPGVGRKLHKKLLALGVTTCDELRRVDAATLRAAVGQASQATLRAYADGKDPRPWEPRPPRKTIGAQSSWGVRFEAAAEADRFAVKLAAEVGGRLVSLGCRGRLLTLKVWRAQKHADPARSKGSMGHGMCDHLSKSTQLTEVTSDGATIGRAAVRRDDGRLSTSARCT